MVKKACECCGQKIKAINKKFCSYKCYWNSMRGKVEQQCIICGNIFWVKPSILNRKRGKCCSKKCADEIRKRYKGWAKFREENHNWKGGISFEPYSAEFNKELKELIRQRDGYKCQQCGCPEVENVRKLDIHHVDYNKKNCLPSNLISLCRKCNGIVNSNRECWTKYFEKVIKFEMFC